MRVLTVHVLLMLKLNKAVTPGLSRILVVNKADAFDGSVALKVASYFGLAGVVVDSGDEKRLERIGCGFVVGRGVPQRNFLFQFVSHLLFFVPFLAVKSETNSKTKNMSTQRSSSIFSFM